EQPEPVAERIELLALDHASAPDADEVGAGALGEAEQVLELLGPGNAVEDVDRHPVPAADRRRLAVDDERVVVAELDRPEADLELTCVVEPLLTGAVRPPELGLVDLEQQLTVEFHAAGPVGVADDGIRTRRADASPD